MPGFQSGVIDEAGEAGAAGSTPTHACTPVGTRPAHPPSRAGCVPSPRPAPAPPAAVKAAGGQVLEGGAGVRVGGWAITSRKGPISGAPPPPPSARLRVLGRAARAAAEAGHAAGSNMRHGPAVAVQLAMLATLLHGVQ